MARHWIRSLQNMTETHSQEVKVSMDVHRVPFSGFGVWSTLQSSVLHLDSLRQSVGKEGATMTASWLLSKTLVCGEVEKRHQQTSVYV